jgi:hypothetical protein
MRKAAFLLCSFALIFGQFASGGTLPDSNQKKAVGDIPPFIVAGMEAYKAKGADEAVKTWIKGSPIEGSKDALSQANALRQVQDFYGAYQSFDVIGTRDLSTKTRILYLILDYDNGPLFAKFVVYHTEKGWILTSFNFNTKDETIPSSLP